MIRKEKDALESHLIRVLQHLLKWKYLNHVLLQKRMFWRLMLII